MASDQSPRDAVYTSPNGTIISFLYEDLESEFEKRSVGYTFPGAKGTTYVQDLGSSGRKFPIRAIFSGDYRVIDAAAFERALSEKGIARFQHPLFADELLVVPFGPVTRKDALVTAANQITIDVTLWETIELVYPLVTKDAASSTYQAVSVAEDALALAAGETLASDTESEKATMASRVTAATANAREYIKDQAKKLEAAQTRLNLVYESIYQGIDDLVGAPLTMAAQVIQMVRSPAQFATGVIGLLEAYTGMIEGFIATGHSDFKDFSVNDVVVSSALISYCRSTLSGGFTTRSQALYYAEQLLVLSEANQAWRDEAYTTYGEVDSAGSYEALQDLIFGAVGYLINASFSLRTEYSITLTRPRSIIDFCAEYYGAIDDNTLDFFITSNNLAGEEILELPRGREIVIFK
jgi:prophage DNA circulation protein